MTLTSAWWVPVVLCLTVAGCAADTNQSAATTAPSTVAVTTSAPPPPPSSTSPASTTSTTSSTVLSPLSYVFPFTGKKVSYGHRHSGYKATDVFGCGATVEAPVRGKVEETRTFDPWVPNVNDPATRGGKYVSLIGDDGVRYYFAHLDHVDVQPGDRVDAGTALGVMGQTGDARNTVCHTHVGISWPCDHVEWAVRRGEVWPWKYLDAWRKGEQLSPVAEVTAAEKAAPDACNEAALAPSADEA